jgi:hypothetical protein
MNRITTRTTLAAIIAAGSLLLATATASAQQKPKAGGGGKPPERVKTYDFTGDDIEGDLVKPDGEFVDTRKFATHTTLIRIRKDFIREIVKSAEDL